VIGLTKNTAVFYGPKGIRCNAIQAGGMQTNIGSALANGFNMEGLEMMQRTCELRPNRKVELCEGADIRAVPNEHVVYVDTAKMAKLISFLCSDDAAGLVNGACWTADGGWTAN